jgi:hypothetical protein
MLGNKHFALLDEIIEAVRSPPWRSSGNALASDSLSAPPATGRRSLGWHMAKPTRSRGFTRLRLAPDRASAISPQPEPDLLEQLRRLGELRDSGVLTAEEFEGKKAELLDRL